MLTSELKTGQYGFTLTPFERASTVVVRAVEPLPTEIIALFEARGRVLAENIYAIEDAVPYARSAMDGYALRAEETIGATAENPVVLPIAGWVYTEAGESTLLPHAAMAISTGAPIPHGADAVVPVEHIQRINEQIYIRSQVRLNDCIFPPAEDVRRGDLLAARGDLLRPATIGLLAFVGKAHVSVYRRPRVALLCTGSELVDITERPRHGQVRNSNSFTLASLIAECGGDVVCNVTVADRHETLCESFSSARKGVDLLVTTGGASVGERDLVKSVLAELGADFQFGAVAIRPGKPIGFAIWEGIPVCVLPGNPAAAVVGFYEFVTPALLRLAGRTRLTLPVLRAKLQAPVKSKAGRKYILFAQLAVTDSGLKVTPLPNQCSVLVRSVAEANALILLPEGPAGLQPGDTVDVQALDWNPWQRTTL